MVFKPALLSTKASYSLLSSAESSPEPSLSDSVKLPVKKTDDYSKDVWEWQLPLFFLDATASL